MYCGLNSALPHTPPATKKKFKKNPQISERGKNVDLEARKAEADGGREGSQEGEERGEAALGLAGASGLLALAGGLEPATAEGATRIRNNSSSSRNKKKKKRRQIGPRFHRPKPQEEGESKVAGDLLGVGVGLAHGGGRGVGLCGGLGLQWLAGSGDESEEERGIGWCVLVGWGKGKGEVRVRCGGGAVAA